jgi:hypothetical protein
VDRSVGKAYEKLGSVSLPQHVAVKIHEWYNSFNYLNSDLFRADRYEVQGVPIIN